MGKSIKGIAMIAVFLGFWYATKNVDFFINLSGFTRTAILVVAAILIYIVVDLVFERDEGSLKRNLVIVAAGALFLGVSFALQKLGVSENVMMVVWFAIPVGLIIYTSKPVQKFLKERQRAKAEEEEDEE
ncbi:MAG: hypothetical protein K6G47_03965 [Clostridia bacterium]|nr:hypothetical protein [Clostridia bacterium]